MCGQAGVFSTTVLSTNEINNLRKLLILNSFRGTDSTGLMSWHKHKNEYFTLKDDCHPFYFDGVHLQQDLLKEWKTNPNLISVHCRAATVGKVTVDNAHPFEAGDVIGMHNGTILSHFEGKNNFDTDSEALYNNINKLGVKEAIKLLDIGAPAYALVWLNKKENTLNFLRNSARPLHIFHTGWTIYWSSDAKDLRYVFTEQEKEEKTKSGCLKNRVLYLEPDKHYKIDLTNTGEIEYTSEEVKPEKKNYHFNDTGGSWRNGEFFPKSQFPKNGKHTGGKSTGNTANNLIPFNGPFSNPTVNWSLLSRDLSGYKDYGSYVHTPSLNQQFAPELDMFFIPTTYNTLVLWRMFNIEEFLQALRKNWDSDTKTSQERTLVRMGLSRNQFKKLYRGRDLSYIKAPYHIVNDKKIPIRFAANDIHRAETLFNKPVDDNKVIPLDTEVTYPYGVSGREASSDDIDAMLNKGCSWCNDPCDTTAYEEIFWCTDTDFLCTSCQDKIVNGEIAHTLIPRAHDLPAHVEYRNVLTFKDNLPILN